MNINFGCGSIQPIDWTNIDLDPEFNTEHKDLELVADNSCDIIVCHAIICCVKYHDIERELVYNLRQKAIKKQEEETAALIAKATAAIAQRPGRQNRNRCIALS